MSEEQTTSQSTNEDVQDSNQEATEGVQNEEQSQQEKTQTILYGDDKSDESNDENESDSKSDSEDDDKPEGEKESEGEDNDKDGKKAEGDHGEYEIKLPEDTRLSDADKERIAQFAKEQGLSKDAAQKLVEDESRARDEYFSDLQNQHKEMIDEWATAVKNDKELGGEKFNESVEMAKRVVTRFGTQQFMDDLDNSGYGNHPEVVRVFARIGRSMGDDIMVKPGSHSAGDRTMEDLFYGSKN